MFRITNLEEINDNYYLIDFEFMYNNTDLYDVACFGNDNIEDGEALLKAYKDNSPSKDDFKRFYLWRMFISLQWFNLAITKHYTGEGQLHNIDFMKVSEHFMNNAKIAFQKFYKL